MKLNSLLVSLVVMSTLFYQGQGIRVGKIHLSSALNHDSQEKGTMVIKGSIKGETGKDIILCKDDEIKCSGLNRKLMTKATSSISTSTSKTTSKNEMNYGNKDEPKSNGEGQKRKEKSLSVNPTSVAQHREVVTGQFSDIVDTMDYSPAKRRPPIHN